MAANQIILTSTADLDRSGLREFSRYSSGGAFTSGPVQLAILAKYYEPTDPWRRWIGVDGLVQIDPTTRAPLKGLPGRVDIVGGFSFDEYPGLFRPHIFLGEKTPLPGFTTGHSRIMGTQSGKYVPTDRPDAHDSVHEGMHPIADYALTIPEIRLELEDRVSKVLDTSWSGRGNHSNESVAQISAGLSRYASVSPTEFVTEALVEWNEFGYRSSPVAIAVGTTIDRYLTRSHGALRVLMGTTQRIDDCFALPLSEAKDRGPLTRQLNEQEIDPWIKRSANYFDAVRAGNPVPMPRFEPLRLTNRNRVCLYVPTTVSHWPADGGHMPDTFRAGAMDMELSVVVSTAARLGVRLDRPWSVEPSLVIEPLTRIPEPTVVKSSSQLMGERAERCETLGIELPDSWQIPKDRSAALDVNFGR